MKSCCFFGHRDAPSCVGAALDDLLSSLVAQGVTCFYVGCEGAFDALVLCALKKLQKRFPHIVYRIVLAYIPVKTSPFLPEDASCTLFPEGIENVPPKYAVLRRNDWMVAHADVVVCYVSRQWGGAAQSVSKACRQGKPILNLFRP